MDITNFTFRLLKHGSIFLLKLVGFAIGLAEGASKHANGREDSYDENDCANAAVTGHFQNGKSCYSDVRCLKYMDD